MTRRSQIKTFIALLTKPLSKGDQILIGSIVLVSIIGIWVLFLIRNPGDRVQIFVDNKITYQYDLKKNGSYSILTTHGSLELQIKDRTVQVLTSTCPAKICKKMGKISKTNQTIVCLPNRILIRIEGKNEKKWIDIITQ